MSTGTSSPYDGGTINPYGTLDLTGAEQSSINSSATQRAQTLRMSQIMSGAAHRNLYSMREPPSRDNPFNTRLYDDRITTEASLRLTPRVATIHDNKHKTSTDIALFDTKNIGYMAEELIGPNVIQSALNERGRSRITSPFDDQLDDYYRGTGYNPRLPISPTNKPPSNKPPLVIDERITHYTGERPYTLPDDQVVAAVNLLRSPDRTDRLIKQWEADKALLHESKVPRAYQPQHAYYHQMYQPNYGIDDVIYRMSSGDNFRESMPPAHREISGVKRVNDLDHYPQIGYYTADTTIDNKSTKSIGQLFTNGIAKFFGFNHTKGARDNRTMNSDDMRAMSNRPYGIERQEVPTEAGVRQVYEQYVTKPNHSIVQRDASGIPQVFPDDSDFAAYMAITKDPIHLVPTRTMAMLTDKEFVIIQKKTPGTIFPGDSKEIGDDLIASSVPVQLLTPTFLHAIKQRLSSNTHMVKLTFEEFRDISNFMVRHPELQHRLNPKDLVDNTGRTIIQEKEISEALVESFSAYPGTPKPDLLHGSQYRSEYKIQPQNPLKTEKGGITKQFDDPR